MSAQAQGSRSWNRHVYCHKLACKQIEMAETTQWLPSRTSSDKRLRFLIAFVKLPCKQWQAHPHSLLCQVAEHLPCPNGEGRLHVGVGGAGYCHDATHTAAVHRRHASGMWAEGKSASPSTVKVTGAQL